MKTIYTILKEDVGRLAQNLLRSELLSERGVQNVSFETARNGVSIEYDPAIVDDSKLLEILGRYGVLPESAAAWRDGRLADV